MRKLVTAALVVGSAAVVAAIFAQTAPPVYFNHATIFVPSEVYAAMLESGFLRNEFSFFRENTVQTEAELRATRPSTSPASAPISNS
jgi:hypothetical protein